MNEQSLLRRSRQAWKVCLGLFWLPLAGLVVMLSPVYDVVGGSGAQRALVVLLGLALGAGGGLWAMISVRCPHCGAQLVAMAITERPVGDWWRWLTRLETCPSCGKPGSTHVRS